jgi:outer membrane protein insertion porin family
MRFTTGILTAFVCTFATIAAAQSEPDARTFEAISVEGNNRFSDQDVMATSGLAPGQPLTRQDLVRAVEALDFTGEFEDIAIRPDGETLVITVTEQPQYSGDFTVGIGFDSDNGVIGFAGLSLSDIFSEGTDLEAQLSVAEEVQTGSVELTNDRLIGADAVVGLRLAYQKYEYDADLFAYERLSFGPFVRIPYGEATTFEVRYAYVRDDMRDVDPAASGILQAEVGERESSLVGANWRTAGTVAFARFDWSAELDIVAAGLGTDNRFNRATGQVSASLPIAQTGFGLRTAIEFGAVSNGEGARATDRFALGGSVMRGFERGGISVRDETGATFTNLGGESFAAARTDLVLPLFQDRENIDTFVFTDVGNVWGLSDTSASDGTVDVDGTWRQSSGIGASILTEVGRFEAYYAIDTQAEDNDAERALGLTFRLDF